MYAHSKLARTVVGAANRATANGVHVRLMPGLERLSTVIAEYRRAIAAERRYDDLERMGAKELAREGIATADISRRIFNEFYSFGRTADSGRGAAKVI